MINKWLLPISLLLLIVITGCEGTKKTDIDVSKISIKTNVERFDKQFFTVSKNNFVALKKKYPFLFPKEVKDSVWMAKIKKKSERDLYNKVQKVFGNFSTEKEKITDLFKHIKYYNSAFKAPKVITLINNLDYENRIIYADSLLLISLDMYLGKKDTLYAPFPEYLAQNFTKSQLLPNIATAIIHTQYKPKHQRQFINTMVNEGKKMYLKQLYLPKISEAELMGYNPKQMQWIQANEIFIWRYFVENKLLYNTDVKLGERFIKEAPFSKFYTEVDRDSPGKVGVWLGWKIVQAYMKNNNVSLQKMLQTNGTEILKQSKYKPKK